MNDQNPDVAQPLIAFLKLFRDIPPADAELIIAAVTFRRYQEGEYLFRAERTCRELFFICKGVLRVMMEPEAGSEVTYFFLKENQFCTILNSFNNKVMAHEHIAAACDAEVLVFTRSSLDHLFTTIPYFQSLFTSITQQALLDKIALRNAYLGQDAATRYRMFMMRQPDIALRVPLSHVASYLGITPQSLSRIRKNMR